MDIEVALEKLIENASAELHYRRHRDQEKTNQRDHGHDHKKLVEAADRLDQYAHRVRSLHDAEFPRGWREQSRPNGENA